MTDRSLVWYAAFGSNLWGPRFLRYLTGGPVPHTTTERIQHGARDPSPPTADGPMTLDRALFFGRSAGAWGGGGVAFVDPDPSPGAVTRGRRWLITVEQLEDVFAQENGLIGPDRPGPPPGIDLAALAAAGTLDVTDAWYGRLVHLGPGPGGHPMVTFTTDRADRHPRRPAHRSYLRVIGLGLIESWAMSPTEAAEYLSQADGNEGVDPGPLAEDLSAHLR